MMLKIRQKKDSSRVRSLAKLAQKVTKEPSPSRPDEEPLFAGHDALFKSLAADCRTYFEYGCGASTVWMADNTTAKIFATDTSSEWIDTVWDRVPRDAVNRLHLTHIDLGELKKWGRPISYADRDRFHDYTSQMWRQRSVEPDLVLIDGRFRVCCFLTSLRHARPGTRIVFDDYMDRPHYHLVEEFVTRADCCGRQVLFIVPEKDALNADRLDAEIAAFQNVMD
jgi:hypothetical protein